MIFFLKLLISIFFHLKKNLFIAVCNTVVENCATKKIHTHTHTININDLLIPYGNTIQVNDLNVLFLQIAGDIFRLGAVKR